MEEYPVYIGGERCGSLRVCREGIMTRFSAQCRQKKGLVRLSVYGEGKSYYLGVMQPRGELLCLEKSFSRAALRELPQKLEYAADERLRQCGEEATLWLSSPNGVLFARCGQSSLIALPSRCLKSCPTRVINGRTYAIFPGKRRL